MNTIETELEECTHGTSQTPAPINPMRHGEITRYARVAHAIRVTKPRRTSRTHALQRDCRIALRLNHGERTSGDR